MKLTAKLKVMNNTTTGIDEVEVSTIATAVAIRIPIVKGTEDITTNPPTVEIELSRLQLAAFLLRTRPASETELATLV